MKRLGLCYSCQTALEGVQMIRRKARRRKKAYIFQPQIFLFAGHFRYLIIGRATSVISPSILRAEAAVSHPLRRKKGRRRTVESLPKKFKLNRSIFAMADDSFDAEPTATCSDSDALVPSNARGNLEPLSSNQKGPKIRAAPSRSSLSDPYLALAPPLLRSFVGEENREA